MRKFFIQPHQLTENLLKCKAISFILQTPLLIKGENKWFAINNLLYFFKQK
jgi:hypothetical protein